VSYLKIISQSRLGSLNYLLCYSSMPGSVVRYVNTNAQKLLSVKGSFTNVGLPGYKRMTPTKTLTVVMA